MILEFQFGFRRSMNALPRANLQIDIIFIIKILRPKWDKCRISKYNSFVL
jgi:hypothetical protein